MMSGKGIPDLHKLENFLTFMKKKDKELSPVTGMMMGKGIPNLNELKEFFDFIENRVSISGQKEALKPIT